MGESDPWSLSPAAAPGAGTRAQKNLTPLLQCTPAGARTFGHYCAHQFTQPEQYQDQHLLFEGLMLVTAPGTFLRLPIPAVLPKHPLSPFLSGGTHGAAPRAPAHALLFPLGMNHKREVGLGVRGGGLDGAVHKPEAH